MEHNLITLQLLLKWVSYTNMPLGFAGSFASIIFEWKNVRSNNFLRGADEIGRHVIWAQFDLQDYALQIMSPFIPKRSIVFREREMARGVQYRIFSV